MRNQNPFFATIPAAYAACCSFSNMNQAAEFQIRTANEAFLKLLSVQSINDLTATDTDSKAYIEYVKNKIQKIAATLKPLDVTVMEVPFHGQQVHIFIVLLKKEISDHVSQQIALAIMNDEELTTFFKNDSGEEQSGWLERQLENSLFTSDHALRIKELAKGFGEYIGLSTKEITDLMMLAAMHDIGKVNISPELLNYPESFNQQERVEMQNHTLYGYLLLHNSPSLSDIAPLILTHHERWDGKGYPIGLREGEIPLASRVIALLDSYDAMVNDRPYRKALTQTSAIKEITDHLGSQFDPGLGKSFIDFLNQ